MFESSTLAATRRGQSRKQGHRQRGVGIIEVIIYLGIAGAILAGVLYYQSRGEANAGASRAASDLALMAGKIKEYYKPSNSFADVSPANVNQLALVAAPMKWDGTNVIDPFGNPMKMNGSVSSFAITVGGAAQPLDREVCNSIAVKLASNAQSVRIGTTADAASGVISGGSVYKANAGSTPDAVALGTGCTQTSAVIAAQFGG